MVASCGALRLSRDWCTTIVFEAWALGQMNSAYAVAEHIATPSTQSVKSLGQRYDQRCRCYEMLRSQSVLVPALAASSFLVFLPLGDLISGLNPCFSINNTSGWQDSYIQYACAFSSTVVQGRDFPCVTADSSFAMYVVQSSIRHLFDLWEDNCQGK